MQAYLWLHALRRALWGVAVVAFLVGFLSPVLMAIGVCLMLVACVIGVIEKSVRIRHGLPIKRRSQPRMR